MTLTFMDTYGKLHIIESSNINGYGQSHLGPNTVVIQHSPRGVPTEEHIAFPDRDSMRQAIQRLEDANKQTFKCTGTAEEITAARKEAIAELALRLAITMASAERARQHEKEGFDAAHDDEHTKGQLGNMAAAYLVPDPAVSRVLFNLTGFDGQWYKPGDDVTRRLVKGVALAVAELERHIRSKLEGRVVTLDELVEKLGAKNKCDICPKASECRDRKE